MRRYEHEQKAYAAKRVVRVRREEERWEHIQKAKQAEEAYWARQRELGEKDRKNHSSVPYDAVSLKYNDGLDGERLRYHDDKVRHRAAVRARRYARAPGRTRTPAAARARGPAQRKASRLSPASTHARHARALPASLACVP